MRQKKLNLMFTFFDSPGLRRCGNNAKSYNGDKKQSGKF